MPDLIICYLLALVSRYKPARKNRFHFVVQVQPNHK